MLPIHDRSNIEFGKQFTNRDINTILMKCNQYYMDKTYIRLYYISKVCMICSLHSISRIFLSFMTILRKI